MLLSKQQLLANLKNKPLESLYFISGTPDILVRETAEEILKIAMIYQFTSSTMLVDNQFDPLQLQQQLQNCSLFSQKEILDVRYVDELTQNTVAPLLHYAQHPDPQKILLVRYYGYFPKKIQNTSWFKFLQKTFVFIRLWPLTEQNLLRWVNTHCKRLQLTLTPQGIKQLLTQSENDMENIHQTLEQLSLYHSKSVLDAEDIQGTAPSLFKAKINDLINTALSEPPRKTQMLLHRLRAESVDIPLICWILSQTFRQHQTPRFSQDQRAFNSSHQNSPGYSLEECQNFLRWTRHIELINKGILPGNPWHELECLLLSLSGVKTLQQRAVCII